MSNYSDPRWQKKRLEVLQRDEWKCVACEDSQSTLHVHHFYYEGELWDVDAQFMQTLCESCHVAFGKHPKGGLYWHHSSKTGLLQLAVCWCPECGGYKFKEKTHYRQCIICGWSPLGVVSSFEDSHVESHSPLIVWGESVQVVTEEKRNKPKEYTLQWLKGMFRRIRNAGNSDADIFDAMFPDSPVLQYVQQLSDLRVNIESKLSDLSDEQQIEIVREVLRVRGTIHAVMSNQAMQGATDGR